MRLFLREKKQKRGMLLQTDSKHMSLLSCGPAVLAVYNVMIFLLLHCYCPQADRNYKCVKHIFVWSNTGLKFQYVLARWV